jgi:hypothetical protein
MNGTVGPVTDSATGVYSDIFISANYGLLTVDTSTIMPANGTDQSASPNAFAKWSDNFNFTPVDGALIGTGATARFSLSLIGSWTYSFDPEAGASTSYDIQANGGDIAMGSFNNFNGASGELNIGNLSSFTFDQSFTIGTPFTLELFLNDNNAIHDTSTGTSSASAHLTLATTGMEILDNSSAIISGSMVTDSGHDYTISTIPEPATWALVPLLAGLVAIRRRRS